MALGRQKRGRHHVTFLTIVGTAIACAVCCLTGCASAAECFGGTEAEGRAVCVGDEHGLWYADNETVRLAHPRLFVRGLDRSSVMVVVLESVPTRRSMLWAEGVVQPLTAINIPRPPPKLKCAR